mmetsp:Transcript_23943/g.34272  ORF Transcript_23943/g.34272 Transcript_23943/m.34272 type:complete len:211 (+) Transcript_23943:696-1328(+)
MGYDIDVCQPFNHAAADVSWDDKADGISSIRVEPFSIGLEGNHDFISWVYGLTKRNGSSVLAKFSPGLIREGTNSDLVWQIFSSNEFDILTFNIGDINTSSLKNIPDKNTFVDISSTGCGTPVETNSLSDHIELLTTISTTRNTDRELSGWESLSQLIHRELQFVCNKRPTYIQLVRGPVQLWRLTVITNDMKIGRRQEPCIVQHLEWRF